MNSKLVFIFSILLLFHALTIHAVTATSFAVTAILLAFCGVVATPLIFGIYNPSVISVLDAAKITTVTCNIAPHHIGSDVDTGSDPIITTRKVTSGIPSELYTL